MLACGGGNAASDRNVCKRDSDCPSGAHCGDQNYCVAERASQPYELVLQVSELPSGERTLSQFTFPAFELTKTGTRDIDVPLGVPIVGLISGQKPIVAEVSFTPEVGSIGFAVAQTPRI
jgi:hypothetical protein